MQAPLRVGIVGTGWGALVHAPAFRVVDGYALAAICARDERRLAAAAAANGITDTSESSQGAGWVTIPSFPGARP